MSALNQIRYLGVNLRLSAISESATVRLGAHSALCLKPPPLPTEACLVKVLSDKQRQDANLRNLESSHALDERPGSGSGIGPVAPGICLLSMETVAARCFRIRIILFHL